MLEEFRRFKDDPVGEEELLRGKNHLKGSLLLSLESTSSRMGNLARQFIYFGRFWGLDEIVQAIDAVTPEAVRDVARDFFRPERLALTAIGPLNGMRIHRKELAF